MTSQPHCSSALCIVVALMAASGWAATENMTDTNVYSTNGTIREGDYCNVTSRDFVNPNFLSEYTVAGDGCTLEDDTKSSCFCAPVLNNDEALSDWKWQCGGTVNFGPVPGKTCPTRVPVPSLLGLGNESESGVVESMLGAGAVCNSTIHPTGYAGDEVCAYSECESGGDRAAVCACVNTENLGVKGGGEEWFCLHSQCECTLAVAGTEEGDAGKDDKAARGGSSPTGSGGATAGGSVFGVAMAVLATAGTAVLCVL